MAADFQILGGAVIAIRGGAHLSGMQGATPLFSGNATTPTILGLTDKSPIHISPVFRTSELHVDDYGNQVPIDIVRKLAEVRITFNLIHFDRQVLNVCISEALGGQSIPNADLFAGPIVSEGMFAPAGQSLGRNRPLYASGCHFIQLRFETYENTALNWRFFSAYLDTAPLAIPIGTNAQMIQTSWRCIPYQVHSGYFTQSTGEDEVTVYPEILSSGFVLWDHPTSPNG